MHSVVQSGAGGGTISPTVVTLAEPTLGFTRGVRLRDSDGHAPQVVQP